MTEFAYYELVHDWPELVVAVNALEKRLRSEGRPLAADILLRGIFEFERELKRIGREMSAFATEELRRKERETRVRPDTEGGGGPRLGDYLVARPLAENLIPGSIGVADEEVLDSNVPWWITNEIGSSARVGGRLFGTFFGAEDAAPPSRDQFRQHPLFEPGDFGSWGGLGVIREPIPARRFIAKAVPEINRAWHAAFDAAKRRMNDEMTRALATYR